MKRWIQISILTVLIACVVNIGVLNMDIRSHQDQLNAIAINAQMADMQLARAVINLDISVQKSKADLLSHRNAVKDVVESRMPSVVSVHIQYEYRFISGTQIRMYQDINGEPFDLVCGAGVVLDDLGAILTAAHVVDDWNDPNVGKVSRFWVEFEDGREADIQYVAYTSNQNPDVGVMWVDPNGLDLHPVPLIYNVDKGLHRGDELIVIGSSLGYSYSVEVGVVANVHQQLEKEELKGRTFLQLSAHMAPGNSGGPVFDTEGNLVGIVSCGCGSTGVYFAVPVNAILEKGLLACNFKEAVDVKE